jgi:hypothetical protein
VEPALWQLQRHWLDAERRRRAQGDALLLLARDSSWGGEDREEKAGCSNA